MGKVSEEIAVDRFRGWLVVTAEMAGLHVIEAKHVNSNAASDPDLFVFGIPDCPVLIVKPKTVKAAGGDNARRGGLSEAQARIRDLITAGGAEYVVWTPEDRLEAHDRLTGHRNPTGPVPTPQTSV